MVVHNIDTCNSDKIIMRIDHTDATFIVVGKLILYPLILLGIVDFLIQLLTNWEFRLIHKILFALFGEVQ